jgi:hypothetical protein
MKKTLLLNVIITIGLLIVIDIIAYWKLPFEFVEPFLEYRNNSGPDTQGRGRYPVNYFIRNDTRGFDIGRNKVGVHWVDGLTYKIWSNSIGCFDREHGDLDRFIYFAGDSFTWGYTPFEKKFGTLLENATHMPILKCGVTHTGQRHQYEKFVDIVTEIGKLPSALFVFYFSNDIANDHVHPHSTVIKGWQLDTAAIDPSNKLIRYSNSELENSLTERLDKIDRKNKISSEEPVKSLIKKYSLSANIIYFGILLPIKNWLSSSPGKKSLSEQPSKRSFYRLPQEKDGKLWFSDNPIANENKAALLDIRDFTHDNNINLIVILIPNKPEKGFDTLWFEQVRNFLETNNIDYLDLTFPFLEQGYDPDELYWKINDHFNPTGDRVIADILQSKYAHIFKQ